MSDLPVGWGNRLNAATEETSTREGRPGDWRANKMKSGTSLIEDNQLASDIPFGFGDRNNSKSLEELSLSANATNVAVAEVGLKSQEQESDENSRQNKNISASSSESHGTASDWKMMKSMASVIIDMGIKQKIMEEKLDEILKQNNKLIAKLN